MNTEDYIKKRLDEQIAWHEKKSETNKKWYKSAKLIVIVVSISIPFLAGFITEERVWLKVVVAIGGLLIAFLEGISALNKYHDNWINYRQTAELLAREKLLFLTKSGPYREDNSLQTLVERVESFTQQENQNWAKYNQKKKSSK
ncbi:MAG: DUF4231 domain-containing protein [Saprospiraceae bacterium]